MPSKRVSLKGKGADLFFGDYTPETQAAVLPADDALSETAKPSDAPPVDPAELAIAEPTATALPRPRRPRARSATAGNDARRSARELASTLASNEASGDAEVIETIRKIVKDPGREVSFVRLSPAEKTQLGDIVYTFKRQGQKTTENELNRIALNYLLWDYHEHGEQSVLARVLAALRA